MDEACGTPKGYGRHLRRGEDACKPCKAAQSADVCKRRRANGGRTVQSKLMNRARGRAQRELARRHADEYRQLMYASIQQEYADDRLRRAATLLEA